MATVKTGKIVKYLICLFAAAAVLILAGGAKMKFSAESYNARIAVIRTVALHFVSASNDTEAEIKSKKLYPYINKRDVIFKNVLKIVCIYVYMYNNYNTSNMTKSFKVIKASSEVNITGIVNGVYNTTNVEVNFDVYNRTTITIIIKNSTGDIVYQNNTHYFQQQYQNQLN